MGNRTPYDEFPLCEVCGGNPDSESDNGCVCPSCTVCGVTGDPDCYDNHGLPHNEAQVRRFHDQLVAIEAEVKRLRKWLLEALTAIAQPKEPT